jgi:hypothetical protein
MPRLQIGVLALAIVVGPPVRVVVHGQVDTKAAAAAIMKADADFNQAVANRDRAQFLSFIAENATFVGASRTADTLQS